MDAILETKKKYTHMDSVLIEINKRFISLSDDEKKLNNKILDQVTQKVIKQMRKKDLMFNTMYGNNFYGGSYYDNLRVGDSKEFDLDLILKLPVICEPKLSTTARPGFVKVKINEYEKLMKREEGQKVFSKFNTLFADKQFMSTSKVLSWVEGLMTKAVNDFSKDLNGVFVEVSLNNGFTTKIYLKRSKSGPAFTLKLSGFSMGKEINLDIDLVPCFVFNEDQWPSGYKKNPSTTKKTFFIVPKKPNDMTDEKSVETYWRLSFQEQERELIKGPDLKNFKLTIKLLKKLRDHRKQVLIASYYIKTIFLLELDTQKSTEFWKMPLSFTFITMVQKYHNYLEKQNIPYYWDKRNNLIGHIKPEALTGMANSIKSMLSTIERKVEDPFVICDYLVSSEDRKVIEKETKLSKKALKNLEITNTLNSAFDSPDSGPVTLAERTKILVSEPLFLQKVESAIKMCAQPHQLPPNAPQPKVALQLKQVNDRLSDIDDLQKKILQKFEGFEKRLKNMEKNVKELLKRKDENSESQNLHNSHFLLDENSLSIVASINNNGQLQNSRFLNHSN